MLETRMERWRFPIGTLILAALTALGFVAGIIRFILGLGATTNLSDIYPWGLWLGFDVFLIPFSAGAFTLAATVYIFNLKVYRPVLRLAILTGLLGYASVLAILVIDLGRPDRFWHFLVFWNPHSPLFEVSWCILLYTTALTLEFSPPIFERFKLEKPLRLIKALTIPLVIAGVTLSTLHQSSLGSLFLIMSTRLHGLWHTPLLPVFFLVSSMAGGVAMVIFVSLISTKVLQHGLEIDTLFGLAGALSYILGLYLVLKLGELVIAGELGLMFEGSLQSYLFLAEMVGGVVLPMVLFAIPRIRRSGVGLFWGALLVIGGLMLNRFSIIILAQRVPAGATYFPHWIEWATQIGVLTASTLVFMLVARFLPLFPEPRAETI